MKKFLILPVAAVLVLSGCGTKNSMEVTSGATVNMQTEAMEQMPMDPQTEAEMVVETEVAPMAEYESSTEVMADIDDVMDTLDSI